MTFKDIHVTPLQPGMRLNLRYFGPSTLRRFYTHRDTGEMVCDVKADTGEVLYLSFNYAQRVMM